MNTSIFHKNLKLKGSAIYTNYDRNLTVQELKKLNDEETKNNKKLAKNLMQKGDIESLKAAYNLLLQTNQNKDEKNLMELCLNLINQKNI